MGTGVPGLAGPPEDCPQAAGSLGDAEHVEQQQDPTPGTPSASPPWHYTPDVPNHQDPERGRGHILPGEGAKLGLKDSPAKLSERKGQAEGSPHLWGHGDETSQDSKSEFGMEVATVPALGQRASAVLWGQGLDAAGHSQQGPALL